MSLCAATDRGEVIGRKRDIKTATMDPDSSHPRRRSTPSVLPPYSHFWNLPIPGQASLTESHVKNQYGISRKGGKSFSPNIQDDNVRVHVLEEGITSYATEWIPDVDDRAVIASRRNRGNDACARVCE